MKNGAVKLTVFFEDPFWVGVFERTEDGRLSACQTTFGAEPKDCEVWAYVLKYYSRLRFSPSVAVPVRRTAVNPKRIQRQLRKQADCSGLGTRSQQALQLQREQNKQERRTRSRAQRELEEQRQFALKQKKRKEKHRGR
ncbi:MAG: YjdF family protein [Agathobaculum sp.]|uniref:YjdF family protein n=1 Tax=Agathobaculum sp. TaxID=2048138 RepID=UPI003D93A3EA